MEPAVQLHLSNAGQLELLRAFKERGAGLRTTVRGASMSPFIRDLDVLTVAPLDGRRARVGDVVAVALCQPQRLAIHRVVGRPRGGLLVRGDACLCPDGVVPPARVLGRVVRVERQGRVVRLGTEAGAAGGALVAALSRSGVLVSARALWRSPRRLTRR
jgi:hypothetical protein